LITALGSRLVRGLFVCCWLVEGESRVGLCIGGRICKPTGISTLAAAGLGNLVSDWGGIGLQGVIEQSMGRKVP
jgi:hypothetical protein